MHDDFGTADDKLQTADDFGTAPEKDTSEGFRVKQSKPRRTRFLHVALVAVAIALAGAGFVALNWNTAPLTNTNLSSNPPQELAAETEKVLPAALLAEAKESWGLGDYEQVVANCNDILSADPKHERAAYIRGASYAELGKTDLAVRDFERAITIDRSLATRPSRSYASAFTSAAVQHLEEGIDAIDARELQLAKDFFQLSKSHIDTAITTGGGTENRESTKQSANQWLSRLQRIPFESPFANEIHSKRRWNAKEGAFTIDARFLEFDGRSVRLLKSNGRTTTPRIDQLSAEDRNWLRQAYGVLKIKDSHN